MADTASELQMRADTVRHSALRWGSKGALAILDQALIAGSNFVVSILLARWLEAADYGGYAVVFSIFLLIANCYQALLLSPSLVLGSTIYAGRRREYLGAMLRFHVLASLVMSAVMMAAAVYCMLARTGSSMASSFAGAAVALPCVLLYWLARSAHYVRLSPETSVAGAVCYSSVLMASLALIRYFGIISAFTGFAVTAAASLVLGGFLLQRLAPAWSSGKASIPVAELWRESWTYGKWELGVSLVTSLPATLCYSVAAVTLGSRYAGGLRALQNIALPLGHTFGACLRLAIPYVCRLYDREGLQAVNRTVQGLTAGALILSAAYLALGSLLGDLPMRWLYDGKFLNVASMIPWILLAPLFWGGVEAIGVGLRAIRYPKGLFVCHLAAAIVYGLIAYPLGASFHFPGIVAGIVATNVVAFAIAVPVYRGQISVQRTAPRLTAAPAVLE